VERFNQLAAGGDMQAILMSAVADQQPQRLERPRRRGRARGDRWAAQRSASGGVGPAPSWAHLARGGRLRAGAP
jgi:hypothetical protein